jgi:predicted nucleotidyltransferase
MTLAKDFEDFFAQLNKHVVKYMVVGGYALAFHGKPRHTGDLDIWIDRSENNATKMLKVVKEFGLISLGLIKDDFLKDGFITQIGYPPLRIDILNTIDGVEFKEAYTNRQTVEVDGLMISYIGLAEFIKNKQAVGRPRDLSDIKEIQRSDLGTKSRRKLR